MALTGFSYMSGSTWKYVSNYVADDVYSAIDNRLAFGFSKTANPSSVADFCKNLINFGSRFRDYPKLGDGVAMMVVP
jgi:hypothetical protein